MHHPAVLIGVLLLLLARRGGRLRFAAIGNAETVLILAYGCTLTWTLQLMIRYLDVAPWPDLRQ